MKKGKGEVMKVTAYKGFDKDWSCRGFAYEVGKTYEHKGEVSLCASGFHACTIPFDVWYYYEGNNFARVSLEGVPEGKPSAGEDSKIVGAKITIEMTLSLPEWIKAQSQAILELCKAAKGALASKKQENAAATGYSGHAAATGYSGHAAATGDSSIAAALGPYGSAKAGPDGWIVLAAYNTDVVPYKLLLVKTAKVGGPEGVEADTIYRLSAEGLFEEVA